MSALALPTKALISTLYLFLREAGGCYPDVTLLPQLADVFGVTVDYLLCGKSVTKQRMMPVNPYDFRGTDAVNAYLSDGWRVGEIMLQGDGDGGVCGFAILEKELCDE